MEFKDKTVLIIGGNSDVGKALAVEFAKRGSDLILTSRKTENLESFSKDLNIRYQVKSQLYAFDVLDFDTHLNFYETLGSKPDIVITSVGHLDSQEGSQKNWEEALVSINTNFTGLVSILNIVANDFEARGSGIIAGISSVAGDRGRGSNYIYGSSKAAFTAYLSGLRNRLSKSGVHVVTVKPGFIATKMTQHLTLPKPVTASAEDVSRDVISAIKKKKNTIYSKWMWKWIMLIIRHIPESIFKKLNM